MSDPVKKTSGGAPNGVIVVACLAFVLAMGGMSYAAVPLYKLFCQVTGFGGTTQRADSGADNILDREITVRFDANTDSSLAWDFEPFQRAVTLKLGETVQIAYRATNVGSSASRGRATFNVTPPLAGAYFNKIACFCFTDTELQSQETMDMPVEFFIDPAILDQFETRDLKTITLSYTFFSIDDDKPVAELDMAEPPVERY